MSLERSGRLDLPYVAAGQLQKHVTVNTGLTRLDVLVQTSVISRTAAPPAAPAEGDLYLATDDWSRPAGTLVRFDLPEWLPIDAPEGLRVWVEDEGRMIVRHDGAWRELGDRLGAVQGLERLGLGTVADAANPFAAKLNKALWTARPTGEGGDGSLRYTLNKDGPGETLSVLMQSGYAGRAEFGLIGDDAFSLKVSADGGAWREALRIDPASGAISAPFGAGRVETALLSSDGAYSPPAWARLLRIVAVGGGGGRRGQSGRRRGRRRGRSEPGLVPGLRSRRPAEHQPRRGRRPRRERRGHNGLGPGRRPAEGAGRTRGRGRGGRRRRPRRPTRQRRRGGQRGRFAHRRRGARRRRRGSDVGRRRKRRDRRGHP